MVLDDEMLSALKHLTREFEISEETVGLGTILEAGPGGQFLDKMHTARHFRREHWEPGIWSRHMLRPWLDAERQLDVDRARELALKVQAEVQQGGLAPVGMPEGVEREVLGVIERARRALMR
jgi:trimethylamine:corrinoid methyltransferase-like protein